MISSHQDITNYIFIFQWFFGHFWSKMVNFKIEYFKKF